MAKVTADTTNLDKGTAILNSLATAVGASASKAGTSGVKAAEAVTGGHSGQLPAAGSRPATQSAATPEAAAAEKAVSSAASAASELARALAKAMRDTGLVTRNLHRSSEISSGNFKTVSNAVKTSTKLAPGNSGKPASAKPR